MRAPYRSVDLTQVAEWDDGKIRKYDDYLAAEEPLEIRIGGKPVSVTMRTPGHDEELAAGFLWSEGIVESQKQIGEIRQDKSATGAAANVVDVDLQESLFELEDLQRNFFAASSCGICGKASIEAIRRRGLKPPDANFRVAAEILVALPDRLRAEQEVFGRTGGLHAAALFGASGNLLAVREDIGRHNAVDKIIGWALLQDRLPLSAHVLMVSGRGGFEIIQKALTAGIPVVASVSAPSSLAVKLARELGLTLIGFLRERRFVIYSGQDRCVGTTN